MGLCFHFIFNLKFPSILDKFFETEMRDARKQNVKTSEANHLDACQQEEPSPNNSKAPD